MGAGLMIVYLFRGYEHVQEDPLLCLMIAQAFMGRAMTRQSDNRNYQISQVSRKCGLGHVSEWDEWEWTVADYRLWRS